ncbi:MAG: Na/Pi cotransporter family protein [Candidatus Micrarchaeia archaeon]
MISWELIFAIVPGLILFIYGIENFSKEILHTVGNNFRSILSKMTKNPIKGTIFGAVATGIAQSSTAITVITISLVNAGVIPFSQSLGVIIGANIGTTVTSQLVALQLTSFAPVILLLGFVIDIFGKRYKFLGKPIFYFGLVFFSLNLISLGITPYKDDPQIIDIISKLSNIYLAIIVGAILAFSFQSSSVATGIVIVLAQDGLMGITIAVPILIGANIGTTFTPVLTSLKMDLYARRAAIAHFIFNFGGALIILPFLGVFEGAVINIGGSIAQQIANAHLLFNLIIAVIFLIIITPYRKLVEHLVPGTEKEIVFETKYLNDKFPLSNPKAIELIEKEIVNSFEITHELYKEAVNLLEKNDDLLFQKVEKMESLNDYLNKRIEGAILELSKRKLTKEQAEKISLLVRMSNEIERIGDSCRDISEISKKYFTAKKLLSPEIIISQKEIQQKIEENFIILSKIIPKISKREVKMIRENDIEIRNRINKGYSMHIAMIRKEGDDLDSIFLEIISINENINSKNREIRKLAEEYSQL